MQAQIIGVAQELSFTDGITVNYMLLQLPNGREIRALIDSDEAMAVTDAFIKTGGPAAQQALSEISQIAPIDEDYVAMQRQQQVRQPHPALSHAMDKPTAVMPPAALDKNYTPLRLDDEGNAEFGGDYVAGQQEPVDDGPTYAEYEQSVSELSVVDRELQQAAQLVANAAGVSADNLDPAALRRAVAALQASTPAPLPQPNWGSSLATTAQPRGAPANRTALTIQADAKGNPVFHGSNVADMRDLAGGNFDGEAVDEVGSI